MKKRNLLAIGAFALLLTACSNDNDLTPPGRDGYVSFTEIYTLSLHDALPIL